jgi:hypothetical protein
LTSVQLALVGDTEAPLADTLTEPVGMLLAPLELSLTVIVQLLAWPRTTGLEQLTVVKLSRSTVIEPEPLLVACVASPAYVAGTLIVPGEPPVKLAEHVAVPALPLKTQLVIVGDTPAPLAVRFTVPVGVVAVPDDVSVTVTVQLVGAPIAAGPPQVTAVDVVRMLTVIESLPELVACVASLAYEADTLMVPVLPPVKLAEHVAGLPLSVQLVLAGDTPAPLAVRFTVPVGVLVVPGDVSAMVMVQLLACPTTTGLTQLTAVEVARLFTVIVSLPLLVRCVPSPA